MKVLNIPLSEKNHKELKDYKDSDFCKKELFKEYNKHPINWERFIMFMFREVEYSYRNQKENWEREE